MNARLRILKYLLDHKEERFSINAIAKALKLNYRIAFESTKTLETEGVVVIRKFGSANQCSISYVFNDKVFLVENTKKEALLKNRDISILCKNISAVQNPLFICLVFGSYAKNQQKKGSDMDICVIAEEKTQETAARAIKSFPIDIHLLVFTPKEFLSLLKTTDDNVAKEIVKNNVILKGAEGFYELVRYARTA